MCSRRRFLQGAVDVGLGSLMLANQQSFAVAGRHSSHSSEAMIFETVRTDGLAHLSYLIGDRSSSRAAVIDPRRDVEVYLELARRHRLTIPTFTRRCTDDRVPMLLPNSSEMSAPA